MQTLIVHGRQPAIARAELESIYGPEKLRPAGDNSTLLDIDPKNIDFMRLGGMLKFCKVLTTLDTTSWQDIEKFLVQTTPAHFSSLPEGKLKIGLSVYGLRASPKQIQATALELKKAGKQTGRSIRVIPNKSTSLNAAQVLHNKLTQKLGWELVFVRDKGKTIVAQSIAVQDIDAYARRDHGRPCRDAKVGMLPPKLAQTIVNLAVGKQKPEGNEDSQNLPEKGPAKSVELLDPFCGTGVVLQEAMLMGCIVTGSDINERMVEYTLGNLNWLKEYDTKGTFTTGAFQADATSYRWGYFDTIASETNLGKPLTSLPPSKELQKIIDECDELHEKFLKNIASQTKPGFRMCLAIPAWSSAPNKRLSGSDSSEKAKNGFKHLKTLDKLEQLGYNRIKFGHVTNEELIYHRPNQVVARELIVLQRK